jgi:hypothetical protein
MAGCQKAARSDSKLVKSKMVKRIYYFTILLCYDLLFHKLPHLRCLLPDNLHQIHPAFKSAHVNRGCWFGYFLLQNLLATGVVDGEGASGRGFDGDCGGCRVGVNGH